MRPSFPFSPFFDSRAFRPLIEVERSGLRHYIMRAQPDDDPRMLALAAARLLTRDDLDNRPLNPGSQPPRLRAA